MIRNLCLVLILVCIVHSEPFKLSFRSSGDILYYYDCSSNPRIKVQSPLLYQPTKNSSDSNFKYIVKYITPETPPDDFSDLKQIEMNGNGNTGFWERKTFGKELFTLNKIAEEQLLFPYFTKKQYETGEEWEVELPLPTAFIVDSLYGNPVAGHKIKVRHKFVKIVDMLGYKCAEIVYFFSDNLISKGIKLELRCKGTVYFAVEEGFLASDFMVMEYDNLLNGKRRRYESTRKLRMVRMKKDGFK